MVHIWKHLAACKLLCFFSLHVRATGCTYHHCCLAHLAIDISYGENQLLQHCSNWSLLRTVLSTAIFFENLGSYETQLELVTDQICWCPSWLPCRYFWMERNLGSISSALSLVWAFYFYWSVSIWWLEDLLWIFTFPLGWSLGCLLFMWFGRQQTTRCAVL